METQLTIRKANSDDLPAIQAITEKTVNACYRKFLPEEVVDEYLKGGAEREVNDNMATCTVAIQDGVVVGYVITIDNLIHVMMVTPFAQRNGVGSALLKHVSGELFETYDTLQLDTFFGNERAVPFYRKHGWIVRQVVDEPSVGDMRVYCEKPKNWDWDYLVELCLGTPDTYEDQSFDSKGSHSSVMKHSGNDKMYAMIGDWDGLHINLKCDPEKAEQYRSMYEGVTPGYHMNKKHWNSIKIGSDVPEDVLLDMLRESIRLTAPKKKKPE